MPMCLNDMNGVVDGGMENNLLLFKKMSSDMSPCDVTGGTVVRRLPEQRK